MDSLKEMEMDSDENIDGCRLSSSDFCYRIMPTVGAISYGYFSVYIMDGAWFRSVFHTSDFIVANCCWFNAHIGFGLYLFGSTHLRLAPVSRRIIYSVFGATLLNFGSTLFWGSCKTLLPSRFRAVFGLLTGWVLLHIGTQYVGYLDGKMGQGKVQSRD